MDGSDLSRHRASLHNLQLITEVSQAETHLSHTCHTPVHRVRLLESGAGHGESLPADRPEAGGRRSGSVTGSARVFTARRTAVIAADYGSELQGFPPHSVPTCLCCLDLHRHGSNSSLLVAFGDEMWRKAAASCTKRASASAERSLPQGSSRAPVPGQELRPTGTKLPPCRDSSRVQQPSSRDTLRDKPRRRKHKGRHVGAASLSTVLTAFISPASCSEPGHRHRDSADTRPDMAEEAPAAAPAKAPKKKSAPRPKKDGPSLPKLIVGAVAESKERKGTSLAALKKALGAKGVDVTRANKRVNTAVIKLVAAGTLTQTRGTGAAGSFKLAKKEPKAATPARKVAKKPAAKAKKPAAKAKKPAAKVKKVAAKKVAAKKVAAKKSPKKSPAKKPAKKVVKKSPKKAAAKKPAAKKTPAKKPAAKK